jgi:hypothetical protein
LPLNLVDLNDADATMRVISLTMTLLSQCSLIFIYRARRLLLEEKS